MSSKMGNNLQGPSTRNRRAFQDVSNGENYTAKAGTDQPALSKKRKASSASNNNGNAKRRTSRRTKRRIVGKSSKESKTNAAERSKKPAPKVVDLLADSDDDDVVAEDEASVILNKALMNSNSSYQYTGVIDEIDEHDKDDPLACHDYVKDIYESYTDREASFCVRSGYLGRQTELNERMRMILIDWLIEVHRKLRMVPETLYLTVNIIDRYLDLKDCPRRNLQLVGVTAFLIASKYEEIYPPDIKQLVYICDNAYTRRDILNMETSILKSIDYKLGVPTAHDFLLRFLKAAHSDTEIAQISCWVMDETLLSTKLLKYLPSEIAAACVFISRHTVGRHGWSPTLLKFTQYNEEEVIPIARAILADRELVNRRELHAIKDKYDSSRFGSIAKTVTLKHDF